MNITADLVENYLESMYKPLTEALSNLRFEAENERIPIILKSTEMFLRSIIEIKKPKNILEIGTAVGYSAACFAEKQKTANVVSIELDEEKYNTAVKNIAGMGLSERVTTLQGDAVDVIRNQLSVKLNQMSVNRKQLAVTQSQLSVIQSKLSVIENQSSEHKFDFVFIDAAKSHYKRFFDAAIEVCTDDAVIISDNVLLKGATAISEIDPKSKHKTSIKKMKEYIEYISSLPYAETCIVPIGDGVALTLLKR
jgi:predicted O-methyltransferase YrrM